MNESTNWYSVKVRNNYENIVADRINMEMERLNMDTKVIIPMERICFAKNGKKVFKEKILYPGYIFVETLQVNKLMSIVRETTGATGILKSKESGQATPLRQSEVDRMIKADVAVQAPVSDELFVMGEKLLIIDGAFKDFKGDVSAIDFTKGKVKVGVSIFGKITHVELGFDEVTKA